MAGLDTEGIVAIAAFIVSVVALLVTGAQLLQALFGTDDGWRRCGPSVMGVWEKTRSSHSLLRELRFETTYCAPEIVLFSPREFDDRDTETGSNNAVHWISPRSMEDNQHYKLLKDTVHPKIQLKSAHASQSACEKLKDGDSQDPEKADGNGRESQDRSALVVALTKWISPLKEFREGRDEKPQRVKEVGIQTNVLVTWNLFLKELHALYTAYWPDECGHCYQQPDMHGIMSD